MEKISCGTNRCPNNVKYHHVLEECYYCKNCGLTLFKKNECTKIGSISEIQYLLTLCKSLWEDVEKYVSKEQLALKWRHELEAHKVFKAEIDSIGDELKETFDTKRLFNLANIGTKISDLKSKIIDSDVFSKYLKHKKLTKHIMNERIEKKELVTQIVCDLAEVRAEEDKVILRDKYQKWRHQFEPKPLVNLELEELKQQHLDEIDELKRKGEQDIEALQTENEKLLAQVVEAEQALNELKNQPKDCIDGIIGISYNAFEAFYKQFIGQQRTFDSGSSITFNLNDDKCTNFIKALSNFSLPKISQCYLNYVPADSQETRDFMMNSPAQISFTFNSSKQVQIEGNKYYEAFKAVVIRTAEKFYIYNTNFSADEFCGILKAAKHIKTVAFWYCSIPFYCEKDLGEGMENCNIEFIDFYYSGGTSYSNWAANPVRFENLIASIAKCVPLVKSLNKIDIGYCDITKDKAQGVLNKYKLNGIALAGV